MAAQANPSALLACLVALPTLAACSGRDEPLDPFCGDGTVNARETCDGDCPTSCDDDDPCTVDAMTGAAETCDVECEHASIDACLSGDGCCAPGCALDADCVECGNGVVDLGETCDPPASCPASCDDGDACTVDTPTGSAATCTADCERETITACAASDGCCPAACGSADDPDCPICDPGRGGLTSPIPRCTAADPCTDLLATYTLRGITEITTPIDTPTCATSAEAIADGRPAFDDGPPRTWTDPDGTTRSWCEYRPPGTSAVAPRPLLIYVTGSGGSASNVYDNLSLRAKAATFDLSGDPSRPGFILVAAQGRNLHWPTAEPQDGSKHDTYYRDLDTPSTNRDFAFYDQLIDALVGEGVVEPAAIFLSGWSNGGRFAALYGIARHESPTAGGNRVAAVANYSAGDPFENIQHDFEPSCRAAAYPSTELPLFLISRTCDAVACDEAQDAGFRAGGTDTTPGNVAGTWIDTLRTTMADPNVEWLLLDGRGNEATTCTAASLCTMTVGTLNHIHWPDGVADRSGTDYEPRMLAFLAAAPTP